jgi:hypothetical protein
MWGFKRAKKRRKIAAKPRNGEWVSGQQAAGYAAAQRRKAARRGR